VDCQEVIAEVAEGALLFVPDQIGFQHLLPTLPHITTRDMGGGVACPKRGDERVIVRLDAAEVGARHGAAASHDLEDPW